MEQKSPFRWSILSIIYVVILGGMFLYVLFGTDFSVFLKAYPDAHYIDLSGGWRDADGRAVSLSKPPSTVRDGKMTFRNKVPEDILPGDSLNLISHNVSFVLYLDDELLYSYTPETNVTGKGTGDVYHSVILSGEDVGKELRMEILLSYEGESGGRFPRVAIADYGIFRYKMFSENVLAYAVSLFIIFLGAAILLIHFGVFRENEAGYNLLALGISVILIGAWTLMESRVLQMLMGSVEALRVINYVTLPLMEYPMIVFINSIAKKKNPIHARISFGVSIGTLVLLFALRLIGGIDMHRLVPLMYISYVVTLVQTLLILVNNRLYCKRRGIKEELTFFYFGAVAFIFGAFVDGLRYLMSSRVKDSHGSMLRLGLLIFILAMFWQIVRWVGRERKTNRRDAFVNSLMQYSLSAGSTEEAMHQMLEYLGKELKAERAYIYEDEHDGTLTNTYLWREWGGDEKTNPMDPMIFPDVVERFYQEYDRSGSMVIEEREKLKEYAPVLYRMMGARGVERMISAPLKENGEYVGFFGLSNPPQDMLEEAAGIVQLLQYFLSETLGRRESERKLIRYSYYDQMTGTKNRRALQEFEQTELDHTRPYGFIMCDINGLKRVNDTEGHEAGDAMIKDVADALIEVLGADVVFRMGGDEFSAYVVCNYEEEFLRDVEHIRGGIMERGRSASMGYVFCPQGCEDTEGIKKQADAMMYADKERYYAGRNDRRQR
ncbi:MAG: GGDEF domain-containing protein [Lachnospiraceae bacterium]|nr:GGDEF domain-containing protein [Lachnospiraceae bacterium]